MKTIIPFTIGEQYENYEFDLDMLSETIRGYDRYLYLGDKTINIRSIHFRIEMFFNADILSGFNVFYYVKEYNIVLQELILYFNKPQIKDKSTYKWILDSKTKMSLLVRKKYLEIKVEKLKKVNF